MIRDLETLADRHGDRAAIAAPGETLGYAALLRRVEERVAVFARAGIGPGERVALTCLQGADTVVSLLALARAEAPSLPLAAALKESERMRLARAFGARWRAQGAVVERLPAGSQPVIPGDVLIALPSSGSTGAPTLSLHAERHFRARAQSFLEAMGVREEDRMLLVPPLEHGFGLQALTACLSAGACLVFAPARHPRTIARAVADSAATHLPAPALFFDWLVRSRSSIGSNLAGLRIAFSVASALPATTHAGFGEAFGVPLWQSYGAGEAGPLCVNRSGALDGEGVALGEPYPGVEIRICDERGRSLPDGEVGEIVAASGCVAESYLGDTDGSSRLERGVFYSGDRGLRRDGLFYFRGRRKLLIETAGRKVDPVEVERTLCRHPDVVDAAVVAQPGHAREIVKAIVVARRPIAPDVLIAWCGRTLAAYKVPRVVEFRRRLPRNALGKLAREALLGETATRA